MATIDDLNDSQNPTGNHILLQCQGAEVLMAHLQRGSLIVQNGETVKVGQAIVKVGNSGNIANPIYTSMLAEKMQVSCF